MTTDAFGVEKAWKGKEGDKRNTKYYLAGVAGSNAGRPVGARAAVGSASLKSVKQGRNTAIAQELFNARPEGHVRDPFKAAAAAPKVMRMRAGGSAGALLGAAAGMGAYGAYRHSQTGQRRIGASVAGQDARRSAELKSLRANPGKSKIEKKKDRGWGFDSEDALERSTANIKSKAGYTKKGERPGKNWRTLGGNAAVGASLGALSGAGIAANVAPTPKSVLLGAGIGGGIGAGMGALGGAATNEYRAGMDAQREAEASGDWREAKKGERASQYHKGVIVPKAKYQKAHSKAMEAENASLRQRLAEREANVSYIHKSAFGVDHEYEVEKAFALKPLAQAAKVGFKGGMTPYAPGTAGARATSAGAGVKSGIGAIKTGINSGAAKVGGAVSAHPKTAIGIGAGTTGLAAGTAGYSAGRKRY
jgi:hypothetical protein